LHLIREKLLRVLSIELRVRLTITSLDFQATILGTKRIKDWRDNCIIPSAIGVVIVDEGITGVEGATVPGYEQAASSCVALPGSSRQVDFVPYA
jgi:hypothetical protein